MLIKRKIQKIIENSLFEGKIIVIYGPRQVGKTTLLKMLNDEYGNKKSQYLNCDDLDTRMNLFNKTSTYLKKLFGDDEIIFIDEAQRVKNIGLTLKIAIDNMPKKQFIVTGSASFDLANKINEPLTGRKYEFQLHPFSLEEIVKNLSYTEQQRMLNDWLNYGFYPNIINTPSKAEQSLQSLVQGTLYKDVLEYQYLKHSELLNTLLKALAYQLGQEVSFDELAKTLQTNRATIKKYIYLLEQAFIIYRLTPFSRNLRNELKKMRKFYFYDIGIRNAIINMYGPINLRNDIGALWENFLISERIKLNSNNLQFKNIYFWRTRKQQEIDYLEEKNMQLSAFEFKWNSNKKAKAPKAFRDAYPDANFKLINRDNYEEFVMP